MSKERVCRKEKGVEVDHLIPTGILIEEIQKVSCSQWDGVVFRAQQIKPPYIDHLCRGSCFLFPPLPAPRRRPDFKTKTTAVRCTWLVVANLNKFSTPLIPPWWFRAGRTRPPACPWRTQEAELHGLVHKHCHARPRATSSRGPRNANKKSALPPFAGPQKRGQTQTRRGRGRDFFVFKIHLDTGRLLWSLSGTGSQRSALLQPSLPVRSGSGVCGEDQGRGRRERERDACAQGVRRFIYTQARVRAGAGRHASETAEGGRTRRPAKGWTAGPRGREPAVLHLVGPRVSRGLAAPLLSLFAWLQPWSILQSIEGEEAGAYRELHNIPAGKFPDFGCGVCLGKRRWWLDARLLRGSR